MSQFGWGAVVVSIIAAWIRSEIAVCIEAVTAWLLRSRLMQSSKSSIEAIPSPSLRFLAASMFPMLLLIGFYVYVVYFFAKHWGKLPALCFIGSSMGFVITFGLISVEVFNHFIPSKFGFACKEWADAITITVFFVVGPPNLYLMWKEDAFTSLRSG